MNNKYNLTNFILLVLLSILSSKNLANTELAPEASTIDSQYGYWDMFYLEKDFIDSSPADRNDGLVVGELGADGGDKKMIVSLAQEIAENNEGKFDSLLISHKNKLIFESYYRRGRVDLPHMQASVTKVYLTLAIGRAIQLGYLTMDDLHKPIVSFLKNLDSDKIVNGVENITLHKAMTMQSGVRISDERLATIREESRKIRGFNHSQEFLQHSEEISTSSQTFKYDAVGPRLSMHVLDSVVPESAKDFIKNEVLAKISIKNYDWMNDINGLPKGEQGSSFTSRDMIKFGQLLMSKGRWKDEQLISKAFIAQATNGKTKPTEDWIPDNYLYGYYWYQTEMKVGNKSYTVNFAWGAGEQYILTIEKLDMVITFTSNIRENATMQIVKERILPAFVK